jgi:uncharacterized membrane protein
MSTLIAPDQTWALWTALLAAAAVGSLAEGTRWGSRVSGAVITMVAAFLLSNLSIIPPQSAVYDTVWNYLVPLAIPLLLLQVNLGRIIREAGATLIAFIIGTVGTIAGTLLAFYIVPLGESAWKVAAVFSATYIGGSLNYVSAARAVGLPPGDLLSAGVAADSLMSTIFFLILFTLPSIRSLRSTFEPPVRESRWGRTAHVVLSEVEKGKRIHIPALLSALFLSAGLCAVSFVAEKQLGWDGTAIPILTALTLVVATVAKNLTSRLSGAHELGAMLMQIFFAAIGASAHIATVLRVGPILFVFAGVLLTVHLLVIMVGGKLVRLSLPEILIASNANVGGPTTAAAMAVARRWDYLVVPAILCGTFGYAIATFIAIALGNMLR